LKLFSVFLGLLLPLFDNGVKNENSVWANICDLVRVNISSALSEGSKDKYHRSWHVFASFCKHFGRILLPATPIIVSAFLSFKAVSSKGMGGVLMARAAIKHFLLVHFPDAKSPTDFLMVAGVAKGIKRRFQKPCVKKKPLDPKDFEKLLVFVTKEGDLVNISWANLSFAAQMSVFYFLQVGRKCSFAS